MDELNKSHNELVLEAWNKICDWCKENLSGKVPGGMVAKFPFQTFGWKCLAVTQDGDVQLHTGSHGDDSGNIFLRDRRIECVSRCCSGSIEYRRSFFCDNDTKPQKSNQQYLQNDRFVMLNTFKVVPEVIFSTIQYWPSLKAEFLRLCVKEAKLKDFEA